MTARLSNDKVELILADYHVGLSQNAIALKYSVSKAVVNKLCKGVVKKNVDNVTDLTRIRLDLAAQSERDVTAVTREVTLRVKDMEFFRAASLKIANRALEKLEDEDLSMYDIERAQNVIGKGKENIYGKMPDTAVQVNNNSQTTYKWESDDE